MAHFVHVTNLFMLYSLQTLRIVFALAIFFHHLDCFEAGGSCGVSFFFVLSGFVLSASHANHLRLSSFSWLGYMRKRLMRFYPLHLVTLLLALWVRYGICEETGLQPSVLWANVCLLQSWFPWYDTFFSGNPVSWYLSDMLFFYALFPFVVRCIPWLKQHKTFICSSVVLLLFGYLLFQHHLPELYGNQLLYIHPLFRIIDFLTGCVTYELYCRIRPSRWYGTLMEGASILLLIAACVAYYYVPLNITYALLFWLPSALLVLVFAIGEQRGGWFSALFRLSIWRIPATLTFSFYMLHWLCIHFVRHYFSESSLFIQGAYSFVVSVLLSILCYYGIEKPLRK